MPFIRIVDNYKIKIMHDEGQCKYFKSNTLGSG